MTDSKPPYRVIQWATGTVGIHAVPAIILNERHLLQGGQPTEVFEQALREIAAKS